MVQGSLSGAQYLSKGLSLIWQPGVRNYVFIPLFINIVLLSIATFFAFSHLSGWYKALQASDNGLIQWVVNNLGWLIWPILILSVLIIVFFVFSFLANWIAAPFNGLLSEAVEAHLSHQPPVHTPEKEASIFSWKGFLSDIPRLIAREWHKLKYYLPRALGCVILMFTPLAFLAPLVWFLFNAWMSAIQYLDYPMDNHQVPFAKMLIVIRQKRSISFSFGLMVMLLTMIPVVNIFLMPVAVAGATNLWFDNLKSDT